MRHIVTAGTALALMALSACSPGPHSPAGAAGAAHAVHVDPAGAAALIASKPIVVVDVRTPAEYASGHIAGATNLDFRATDFATRVSGLDRQATYLVHCAAGGRSTSSLETFDRLGFTSVVHLDGGLNAWKKAGQATVK